MRRGALILIVILLGMTGTASASTSGRLVFPVHYRSVTLVTPAGAPVGGEWQQWANEISPAYRGVVTLDLAWNVDAQCDQPAASCSDTNEIWEATNTEGGFQSLRSNLYYELGHIYDHAYLTDSLRARIMRLWGLHWHGAILDAWWDGEQTATVTDVPGEWFAQSYEFCVMYPNWNAAAAWKASWFSGFLPGEPAADSIQQAGPVPLRLRQRAIVQQRQLCRIVRAAYSG